MLKIQKFLKDNIKNYQVDYSCLDFLNISYKFKNDLCLLDYNIDSPKTNELVVECRGLCLHKDSLEIKGMGFKRFFNFKEAEEITSKFDWEEFSTFEKVDGSLIKVSWYDNELLITTRFSFADSECGISKKSWKELVIECLTKKQKQIIKQFSSFTFVGELLSPYNQVVKYHNTTNFILLTIVNNITGKEWQQSTTDEFNKDWCFVRPKEHHFKSDVECFAYLDKLNEERSTDEGFVLIDSNGLRLKIKNKYYVLLHSLNGNGEMTSLKKLLPVILNGEIDEIISYFPHLKDIVSDVKMRLDLLLSELLLVWDCAKDIESQKDFANKIIPLTKMSSILFKVRKAGGDIKDVAAEFKKSEGLLIKIIDIDL